MKWTSLLAAFVFFVSSIGFANVDRPPQFVLLAFDGSKSVSFWQNSRLFAKQNDVLFTYFISGVYFLNTNKKSNYIEPSKGAGQSAIGFGGTESDIQLRLEQVRLASIEGHEMASHANAHYDGAKYTEAQWNLENRQFTSLIANAWKNNGLAAKEPSDWSDYFTQNLSNDPGMVGFRAPLLGVGDGLWKSLKTHGILYDTSRIDRMSYWPTLVNGIWNFPLAGLTIVDTGKKTLSMDYNFYVADSKGVAGPSSEYSKYEDRMYRTYLAYFQNNYLGNRAPVHIGHHFSLWNGGAYWRAMQRFAKTVCAKPEVRCVTYKELLAFVETYKARIPSYQAGQFDKLPAKLIFNVPPVRELTDEELQELATEAGNHAHMHEQD